MRIGVVGLGRFGRFWAEMLKEKAEIVYAWNRTPGKIPPGVLELRPENYRDLDCVFLCTSINSVEEVAGSIAKYLYPGTIVADTCSVKVEPLRALENCIPKENPVLGTHPMFGPDSARDGVAGLPMVLTAQRISDELFRNVYSFFENYDMQLYEMTAEEHDREAAYTQGITHFIGRVLADMKLKPSPIATLGYKRLLQVMEQTCNDPWSLFVDLQQRNPYTSDMRRSMQESLSTMLKLLGDTGPQA